MQSDQIRSSLVLSILVTQSFFPLLFFQRTFIQPFISSQERLLFSLSFQVRRKRSCISGMMETTKASKKKQQQQHSKELQKLGRDNKKGTIRGECCCMCGDVGFEEQLFRCNKCSYRFQHIYCSRFFTSLQDKVKTCEWCLDVEAKEKLQQSNTKRIFHTKGGNHESGCRAEDSEELQDERYKSNIMSPQNVQSTSSSARGLGRRYRLLSEVLY